MVALGTTGLPLLKKKKKEEKKAPAIDPKEVLNNILNPPTTEEALDTFRKDTLGLEPITGDTTQTSGTELPQLENYISGGSSKPAAAKPSGAQYFSLREREKLKKQALDAGASLKEAAKFAGDTQRANMEAGQAEAQTQKKQAELANVTTPRAENLVGETISIAGEQGASIFGSNALSQSTAAQMILTDFQENPELQKKILDLTKYMVEHNLTPEQVTSDPTEQALLTLKLNDNDIKILNEGKADVSSFSKYIEGLPLFSQFTKFTGGALTPTSAYAKINDLADELNKVNSKMEGWNEAITRNPPLADRYESLVNESEQNIFDLQSRIKLLFIQSPIFQNSPEKIEGITQEIDKALTLTTKLRSTIITTKYGGQ